MEKKRLLTAIIILALLFSAVAGTQFVNLGRANPFSQSAYSGEMSPPASVTPPSVLILHPENNKTYNENSVNLTLYAVVGQAPHQLPSKIFHGLSLTEVYYEADWLENKTMVNGTSKFYYVYDGSVKSENFYDNFDGCHTGSYSCRLRLEGVPDGNHIITVNATERGYYYYVEGRVSSEYYGYSISNISSVTFTVDTVPIVSLLSFENTTIDVSNVPLNFTVNQVVSHMTYCLDGQENVTIAGNTTLTGLPNGNHSVAVYATDATGNTGASETIFFTTAEPEPESFPAAVAVASSSVAVVIGLGLAVYFTKTRRTNQKIRSASPRDAGVHS